MTKPITAVRALPPQALNADPVPRVGACPDEVIERQRQRLAQPAEPGSIPVNELTHPQPSRASGGNVLQRIVVRAGEEPHRLAA